MLKKVIYDSENLTVEQKTYRKDYVNDTNGEP